MAEATETHSKARELPGHDIFCTPENSDFLSKVSYGELNATKREIRLLKILPDSGSGFVECELLPSVRLADVRKQYLALSYCAGNARNTKTIIVNGARCNVFANLHHALTVVRHYWKKHADQQDFLLWVDQLCINQADLTERSHQVGFMREIYQNAKRTLICLSTRETEGQGMKWFIELRQNWQKHMKNRPIHPLGTSFEVILHQSHIDDDGLREFIWENADRKEFTDGWIAFYDVCESPWWRRAWVAQEFMVSDKATFLFGPHSIPHKKLIFFLGSLMMTGPGLAYLTDEHHFLHYANYDIDSPHHRQFYRVVEHVKSLQLDKTEGAVRVMVSTKFIWREISDLKRLLLDSRCREASDERDRIYSVIGLADPGYGIVPNYLPENRWNDVLVETTRRIITFEDSLDVLSCSWNCSLRTRQSKALPSWVIDWSQTTYDVGGLSSIRYAPWTVPQFGIIDQERADASFKEIPNPESSHGTTITAMEVWGVFLDTVFSPETPQKVGDPSSYNYHRSPKGYKIEVGYQPRLEHNHELWVLCGSCELFLLEPRSNSYRLVDLVDCPELNGDIDTVPDSLKEFINESGYIDTARMGRRRIAIF